MVRESLLTMSQGFAAAGALPPLSTGFAAAGALAPLSAFPAADASAHPLPPLLEGAGAGPASGEVPGVDEPASAPASLPGTSG
jgi:hypothetical protein